MTKDVWIKVIGTHSVEGETQEPVITEARGKYAMQDGKHYLRFTEVVAETGENLRTLMKGREGVLEVTRQGPSSSRLRFEAGIVTTTHYNTSVGDLEIDVLASEVTVEETPRRIVMRAVYTMHSMGQCLQHSTVEVIVIPYPII